MIVFLSLRQFWHECGALAVMAHLLSVKRRERVRTCISLISASSLLNPGPPCLQNPAKPCRYIWASGADGQFTVSEDEGENEDVCPYMYPSV
jgi:hypothetical protein